MEVIDISAPIETIAGPRSLNSAPRAAVPAVIAETEGVYLDFDDPRLVELLRTGARSEAGMRVSIASALKIPTVLRSVSLISDVVGMLPLRIINKQTKEPAKEHPLYKILHRRPNDYQTAYEFRKLLEFRRITSGNGYARIARSVDLRSGREKVIGLVPLESDFVEPLLSVTGVLTYRYQPPRGEAKILAARDVLHLRNLSVDGLTGISQVYLAADAIGLTLAAQQALSRLYRNGSFVNGYLATDGKMSDTALRRLRQDWDGSFSGSENAGRTPIFEGGLKYEAIGTNAKDSQSAETRKHQTEEILRVFGLPRPLAMVDETSWGSGIDSLGQFLVQYTLSPAFEAWQQRCEASLLSDEEQDLYEIKFNPDALLRGSTIDQGEYFSKALGAGGHQPWLTANEVREALDRPPMEGGDRLENPMTAKAITDAGSNTPAEQGAQANG